MTLQNQGRFPAGSPAFLLALHLCFVGEGINRCAVKFYKNLVMFLLDEHIQIF